MKIFKYPLNVQDEVQLVEMELQGKPLTVQVQNGIICVWVQVDESSKMRIKRKFHVIGTGHRFDLTLTCDTSEPCKTVRWCGMCTMRHKMNLIMRVPNLAIAHQIQDELSKGEEWPALTETLMQIEQDNDVEAFVTPVTQVRDIYADGTVNLEIGVSFRGMVERWSDSGGDSSDPVHVSH